MKVVILISVAIVLTVVFSGCTGKSEEKFWYHILKANDYIEKRSDLWEEAKNANNQGDYDKAEQLFKQMVEYDRQAIEEMKAAINSAPNEKLKKWAEYMKKSAEYGMLADQKLVEMVQYSKAGDEISAEVSLKEYNEFARKAKEILKKAKELEIEGLK
jgi:hypothetical protein